MKEPARAGEHRGPRGRIVALIPARYHSSRLPGKPLARLAGKPMIQHVYERAAAMPCLDAVLVATDDARIADAVRAFGGEVVMTRADHATGTDRLGEAARDLEAEFIVNIQGDEPLIQEVAVRAALAPLLADAELPMSSIRVPLHDPGEVADANVVKVVTDLRDFALYFSRAPIPAARRDLHEVGEDEGQPRYWKHVGLYGYRREFLLKFVTLPRTPLERLERLEQLRALEHGYRIKVPACPLDLIGVDTPADLERVRALLEGAAS
ncbi:MAG: 3-deoxy-manno-octulosonate cytidylyltransferase [Candidatus Tectomicrobia bacterium]|nr:3-deoxy-manno-octulosonate cytidylyltransferase [Candidatus Tectomicrobia bacterium]